MFIQEIIIDGFKSYAHRTTVEGFDPHFNAITGLNGSGKSNILDAICFVLGITNLSQVRAGNLSELVYKQGQAGVNKATVTIVFNNEDTSNSPVGFEQCAEVTVTRQVLLGGKSKYLINGRNAPANAVQNLFHSVQLNVNNPHFLIMQGRITKVLNMKSHEILGMVEEAAGTRMYETKRVAALKTIEKKQAKVDEINSILEEEITPTLERLRGEKQNYLKWSKNSADVERIERFCIAHQFHVAQSALEQNVEGVTSMEEQIVQLDAEAEQIQERIAEKDREIALKSSTLKGEMGEKLALVKKLEQERSNELVRITSIWKNRQESLAKAEADLDSAKKVVEETQVAIVAKEKEILDDSNAAAATVEAALAAERELERLTLEYQRMSAGMSASTEDRTLPEQISQAHADSKMAESKIAQAKMKVSHLAKELKAVEKEIKKEGDSSEKLMQKKDALSKKVNDIASQISKLNFSSSEFEDLEQQMSSLQTTVTELSERVDTLQAQLSGRLGFEYSDPVRGFDRSKVKGLVAKLIEVHDSKHATALEVVAGGKLFQVVVDEAITGKALLDRGKLKKRVTIIPLDKIQPRQVGANACQRAHQIATSLKAMASPAIELVGFDEEVRSAIEYVFGSSIVVDGMKAANEICDITKTRTVTLEGDVYDPSGTISGGSSNQLGTTLVRLTELSDALKKLQMHKPELEKVLKKIKALKADAASFDKLNTQLEIAQAELNAAEKHLSQTNFGMLVEKRDSFIAAHEAAEQEIVLMTQEKDDKWKLYQNLQEKEAELTKQRENRLSDIEESVKAGKMLVAQTSVFAREASSRSQTLSLELESLQNELIAAKEAASLAEQAFIIATNDESESQMEVGETSAKYEEARQELDALERKMSDCTAGLSDLKRAKSDLVKAAESARLESKKLSVIVTRIRKDRLSAEKAVTSLLKTYSWIESEMSAFGVRGGDYDFDSSDPKEVAQHLKTLKNEQDSLSKKINKKVMGMIEKAEGEYAELLRKRKVVENDKKKIQDVIKELDIKKKSELQLTWQKVNRDFGSVFSALLPGAKSKLEPPEGMEAWEGLEVKVSFGDVWKESLTELSGGQRSLLALSLILALLLFKPAPMYILDEVDAALDLSHTQNIGNMLKTHFSQSQFIVVSLKEGMFSNANVIFRTKFVDGVSTVTRTIGTGASNRSRSTLLDRNEDDDSRSSEKINAGRNRKRGKENA